MTNSNRPLFILIDASSYLHRAFHALPPLTNRQGEPTGAIYGVVSMIKKLLADYDPEYIGVIFDAKGKTFRNDLYPAYKAHRPPMPEELRVQIQPLYELIKALGLPLLAVQGVEADDVIATLAIEAQKKNMKTLISTGDKDLAQLVNDDVTLINTMKNPKTQEAEILDPRGVIKKFGVSPENMLDYLTLMGDTSDNIPGVPKVGPKTAVKWLQEYGSLDNIINHANDFTGKIGENLRESISYLELSRKLIRLKYDVTLPCSLEDLRRSLPDETKLFTLFKHLEFQSWIKELSKKQSSTLQSPLDYQTILTQEVFEAWLIRLKNASCFSFDTETTSLNTLDAALVGISFAVEKDQAAYVPLAHNYPEAPDQLSRDYVLEKLKPLLNDPNNVVIGQNLKYDMGVLANYNVTINASIFDTMLESYLLNTTNSRHDLDSLALKHLGKESVSFEDIAGKGAKQLTFNQILLEQASPYAAQDADFALQIHHTLWPFIEKNEALKTVLLEIELPLISVLSHIEREGVMIDCERLAVQSKELASHLAQLETEAYQLAGVVFNLSSPKQLQEILYDKLKLPVLSKTPTGAASTAESVLQELALDYPLPKIILTYRSLSKLKSTYTDSLPKQINPKTGRIHTSYNQAVTSTGRLSSTDPNLQNIPIRHEEGRRIRQAFIAPPGYKIVSADYSQIELRIMAHLCQDPGLLKAFSKNHDIHAFTASEIFGVPLEAVTVEQRRQAKSINFGLIYGMSAYGLSRQLGLSRNLAQEYIDKYFLRYPNVKTYMNNIRESAHKTGYVETLLGRRLYIPEINSPQMQRQHAAERAAINAPMQGTAADIIKIAMIRMDQWLKQSELDVKMIMQVHDELVFEIKENDVEKASKHICQIMTTAVELSVPLEVNVGTGDNWDEAH